MGWLKIKTTAGLGKHVFKQPTPGRFSFRETRLSKQQLFAHVLAIGPTLKVRHALPRLPGIRLNLPCGFRS